MLHQSVDHILSDLPAARAAWFHVTAYRDGAPRADRAFTDPARAWTCFLWARLLDPGDEIVISRRGNTIHRHVPVAGIT